jgi:hypothetical protein
MIARLMFGLLFHGAFSERAAPITGFASSARAATTAKSGARLGSDARRTPLRTFRECAFSTSGAIR